MSTTQDSRAHLPSQQQRCRAKVGCNACGGAACGRVQRKRTHAHTHRHTYTPADSKRNNTYTQPQSIGRNTTDISKTGHEEHNILRNNSALIHSRLYGIPVALQSASRWRKSTPRWHLAGPPIAQTKINKLPVTGTQYALKVPCPSDMLRGEFPSNTPLALQCSFSNCKASSLASLHSRS